MKDALVVMTEGLRELRLENERLRRERLEWFIVARQLRGAVMAKQEVDEAISDYLRVRGSLEDPRDGVEKAHGD